MELLGDLNDEDVEVLYNSKKVLGHVEVWA